MLEQLFIVSQIIDTYGELFFFGLINRAHQNIFFDIKSKEDSKRRKNT